MQSALSGHPTLLPFIRRRHSNINAAFGAPSPKRQWLGLVPNAIPKPLRTKGFMGSVPADFPSEEPERGQAPNVTFSLGMPRSRSFRSRGYGGSSRRRSACSRSMRNMRLRISFSFPLRLRMKNRGSPPHPRRLLCIWQIPFWSLLFSF